MLFLQCLKVNKFLYNYLIHLLFIDFIIISGMILLVILHCFSNEEVS